MADDVDAPGQGDGPRADPASPEGAGTSVSSVAAIRGVLHVSSFRRLWYSTALSSLGDWLGLLATSVFATGLVTGYAAANFAFGAVLLVRLLPAVVFGPIAGIFADRFDRRHTMVVSDFVRFALFVSIPLVNSLLWLFIATFLIECVAMFWLPAKDASVPNLVRRDQIEAANQLGLITTYGVTPVLGAGLFSLLAVISSGLANRLDFFATNQVDLALYFNAATFLVGAIIVYFIREIGGSRTGPGENQDSLFTLMREGARFMGHSKLLKGLIVGLIGAFLAASVVIGAGNAFAQSIGGGDATFGILFGSVFVGMAVGLVFGPRIARELSRQRLFGLAIVTAGVSLSITALMPVLFLAVVFVIAVGAGGGVAYLAGVTLMGTEISDDMRGRVFALIQSLIRIVLIVGVAAVPFVIGGIGQVTLAGIVIDASRIALFAGGIIAVLFGLWAYRLMDQRAHGKVLHDVMTSLRGDSWARRRMRGPGVLLAFEGGEGAGKSSQITMLADRLRAEGRDVLVTHEPGATPLGRGIRELLLHGSDDVSPRAEALLFAADRAQHVDAVIVPALRAGTIVITDRYVDSSLAYQGAGRELTVDEVFRLSRWATQGLRPDLTVLLDVPAHVGLARARGRSDADRLESESLEFHERVRRGFRVLAEAEPRRYAVVDATADPSALAETVRLAVEPVIGVAPDRSLPAAPRPPELERGSSAAAESG
ncbi:dTMP kinase [Jatrophihabitans sp. YIM 134969]